MKDNETAFAASADAASRLRIACGLDVETAARTSGLTVERLEAFEAARTPLTVEELGRLADTLGVPTEALFGARTTPIQYLD